MKFTTPVLFLIFNRPDSTLRVFNEIRRAQPSQLFVAADGPREDKLGEADRCMQVRRIIDTVDWDCEVVKLYREENLGCRKAVSSAIDWFFENVEEGIILEDDCLPSRTFFRFCQELLEYYRNDVRVMQICGSNLLKEWTRSNYSYLYSNYGPIWGWASWRRAWTYYDVNMTLWPKIKQLNRYKDFCQNEEEAEFRLQLYDKVFRGEIDTWDYQWGFAKMINSGFSITPTRNLISNIGFGKFATHTKCASLLSNLQLYDIEFPLHHPAFLIRDKEYDAKYNMTYLPRSQQMNSFFCFM